MLHYRNQDHCAKSAAKLHLFCQLGKFICVCAKKTVPLRQKFCNMKRCVYLMPVLAAFVLNSCFLARIVTVAPEPVVATSTTVYVPQQKAPASTTTVQVTPTTSDISLYLDLRAIGAAFGQANSVQEFEMMINSSQYMLSNLDLNRDGYVDYLRVMEAMEGYNHVFVIQAVLAQNIYQDVATIVVERGVNYATPYVQIIGHTYVYGRNYIIEPVFYREPPMFVYLRRANYKPWRSPYVWGYFPSCYHKPAPIYLSHYQAYVCTYMDNHRYCHEVHFVDHPHYVDYTRICQPIVRQDYAQSNPQGSFVVRNAGKTNTRDISMTASAETGASSRTSSTGTSSRTSVPSSASTTTAGTSAIAPASSTRGTTTAASTSSRSNTPAATSTGSRTTATTTSRTVETSPAASTRSVTTSVSSPARNSEATTISSSTTPTRAASVTVTPSRTTTSTAPTSTRTASTASSTRTTGSTSASSSASRTSSSAPTHTPSTTVTSRVNTNGVARTQTRTVSATGATTTTTRGAATATSSRETTSRTVSSSPTSTSTSTRGASTSTRR